MMQTLDFFPPIADDPYLYGQMAAANALSDIHAMGGEPRLVLNMFSDYRNEALAFRQCFICQVTG